MSFTTSGFFLKCSCLQTMINRSTSGEDFMKTRYIKDEEVKDSRGLGVIAS